jgi:hypothetical protein
MRKNVEDFIKKIDSLPGGPALNANFLKDLTISRFTIDDLLDSPLSSQCKVDLHLFIATATFLKIVGIEEIKKFSSARDFSVFLKPKFRLKYLKTYHLELHNYIVDDEHYNGLDKPEYNATRLIFLISERLKIKPIIFDRVLFTLGSGRWIDGAVYSSPNQRGRMHVYQKLVENLGDFELDSSFWASVVSFTINYFNDAGLASINEVSLNNMVVFSSNLYLQNQFNPEDKIGFAKFWWSNRLNSGASIAAEMNSEELRNLIARCLTNSSTPKQALNTLSIEIESGNFDDYCFYTAKYAQHYCFWREFGRWPDEFKSSYENAPLGPNGMPRVFGNNIERAPTLFSFVREYFDFLSFIEQNYQSIEGFYENFVCGLVSKN